MPHERSAVEERRLVLMQAIAEALAMPERLCAKRACRREHACLYDSSRRQEPMCLDRLWPWQRALFDDVFRMVAAIHDNTYPPQPSQDPERRALEAAAIEIIRLQSCYMPDIARRFQEWRKRYSAPPAPPQPPVPPVDTAKLVAGMKAELERYRIIDETRAETEALRQRLAASPGGKR